MHKELEQWNDMLKTDVIKFCQENNFTTGFFEGSDSTSVVDAYELKVVAQTYLYTSCFSEVNGGT